MSIESRSPGERLEVENSEFENQQPLTREEWEKAEGLYYGQLSDQARREKVAKKNHMFAPPPPPRMLKEKQELLDRYLKERQELIQAAETILSEEKKAQETREEYIKNHGGEYVKTETGEYTRINGRLIKATPPPRRLKENDEIVKKYYMLKQQDSIKEEVRNFSNPDLPKPPPPRRKK